MTKKIADLKYAVPLKQQEFPMNPQLYSFQVYHTDSREEYTCMMKAFFAYRIACAQAELALYKSLQDCLKINRKTVS